MPGDIVLINAGEVHDGSTLHGERLEYKVFYVEPAVWSAILNNNSFAFHQTIVKDALLFQKINAYFNDLAANNAEEMALHERYSDILLYVAGRYSSLKEDDLNNDHYHEKTLALLKEYIQDNLEDDLSLNKLAKLSAISPFHLLRLFTKQSGLTLHQFILVKKIERAKCLLKKKESIIDVAYSLGFSDQSHFTRIFKKMSGLTPGRFQKQLAG